MSFSIIVIQSVNRWIEREDAIQLHRRMLQAIVTACDSGVFVSETANGGSGSAGPEVSIDAKILAAAADCDAAKPVVGFSGSYSSPALTDQGYCGGDPNLIHVNAVDGDLPPALPTDDGRPRSMMASNNNSLVGGIDANSTNAALTSNEAVNGGEGDAFCVGSVTATDIQLQTSHVLPSKGAAADTAVVPSLADRPAMLPLGWRSTRGDFADARDEIALTEDQIYQQQCRIDGLAGVIRSNPEMHNAFTKLLFNLDRSWNVYDPVLEMKRMGVPNRHWRFTSVNRNYQVCSSYPSVLVVPAAVNDDVVIGSAQFRSMNRLPTLSWLNRANGCSISRCSQPLVGLGTRTSQDDERLLAAINACGQQQTSAEYHEGEDVESNDVPRVTQTAAAFATAGIGVTETNIDLQQRYSDRDEAMRQPLNASTVAVSALTTAIHMRGLIQRRPFIIVDARPLLNARANQAAGKGVESDKVYENVSVLFMDIANIHAVRKSLELLEDACVDEVTWVRNADYSGWLGHLRKILLAVGRIVHCVAYEHLSVLVHCSDGWDRTAQLTSLSM
jgi:hypothetical protein